MPTTPGNLRYPSTTDPVDVPGDIKKLADDVDTYKAPLSSPALTGSPTAPTAAADTDSTQIATTAYVLGQASVANPQALGTTAAGTSKRLSRADHVHPMPSASDVGAVPTSRTVSAGNGLTGGGDLSANRTLSADFAASAQALGVSGAGTATTVSRGDHVHAMPSASDVGAIATSALTSSNPVALSSTASPGTSGNVARLDHVHPFPTAANVGAIATTALTNTNPANLGNVAPGTSSDVARRDHVHAMPTAADVGAVANSLVNAKGDLITATANDTPAILSVGANGRRLEAASGEATGLRWAADPVVLAVAVSDETTNITTGTAKVTFRMPFAMTVTAVRASLTTASTSGNPTFDINEGGTSILGANKLSIDANEKTSTTAATATTISDSALADDAEITIDIDTAGTGAKGAKVYLIGTRA